LVKQAYDILDIARFYSKVDVGKKHECWLVNGIHVDRFGYGCFTLSGVQVRAHRFSYQVFHGKIGDGLVVRHKCDTPLCVNPYHLETGTVADNVMDRVIRGRSAIGERNGKAKLTAELAKKIFNDKRPYPLICAEYGLNKSTVSQLKVGKTWSHVTGKKYIKR
jgi:hypothetical protein